MCRACRVTGVAVASACMQIKDILTYGIDTLEPTPQLALWRLLATGVGGVPQSANVLPTFHFRIRVFRLATAQLSPGSGGCPCPGEAAFLGVGTPPTPKVKQSSYLLVERYGAGHLVRRISTVRLSLVPCSLSLVGRTLVDILQMAAVDGQTVHGRNIGVNCSH